MTSASTMIISRGTEMKFTKKEICGMYTVAQATEIAGQFEDDTEWDFWKYIIDVNNSLFQVLESLNRRCDDSECQGNNSVV